MIRPSPSRSSHGTCRDHAFTLVELIVVIVILAILAAVALPRYFDHGDAARKSAADGSLGGIRTALNLAYVRHRVESAPAGDWIDDLEDIAGTLTTGQLPEGVLIAGTKLQDHEGSTYTFTPETAMSAARLEKDGGGSTSPSIIAALMACYLARRRRKQHDGHAPD